jgi:hypothetical protein
VCTVFAKTLTERKDRQGMIHSVADFLLAAGIFKAKTRYNFLFEAR